MPEPTLHIALYHPEIPPNTGNIGRLCVGIRARLHVVHPISFSMDAKQVRRAGLDYWKHVDLMEHASEEDFWAWVGQRRVHLLSAKGGRGPFTQMNYQSDDVLVFGRETKGLPDELVDAHGAWQIPMLPGPIRSLNLSNAVAVVAYHALAQVQPDLF
ncbi:MAG: tRNA (uridine(34)/cytosine(34)/5-carboxymethylaminomethyluridine(34)-2'-O)-methyltransferase TrmL [Rhodobacterales bacterium]|nr:tRNA (uridine(34)/cytosine(34)/5-carboxymethylaminomethyluridine(34)-2'-O)-methyltransferase TrmL [Rhodobacterales bacterium]